MAERKPKSKGNQEAEATMEKADEIAAKTEDAVEADQPPAETVDLPTGERSHPPA